MFSRSIAPRLLSLATKPQLPALRTFTSSSITKQETKIPSFADISKTFSENSNKNETTVNIVEPNAKQQKENVSKKIEVVHRYVLYGLFSKNNTHLTLSAVTEDLNYLKRNPNLTYNQQVLYYAKLPQKVKISLTGGSAGFRKSARGEYEAGFQASAKMFNLMAEKGYLDHDLEIVVKEFGKGREAFLDALKGKEGNRIRHKVVRVRDATKLKFGGVRAPRRRRL
ncbi:37S ribosomal protein S18, mitochondrial [Wickerhamomyces ciferrii]|uniref:Small ribosomal subunit protein uS11m n=1 Tax=Wickerhamomyces ciferrii (strain ATCC 14091 / BCRC 22168 / CBS 111 / JCM 3599 / NBRC 0793 / NRRL Y-1031 F-60-10) TaxID=1206466 RepID=K0KGX5_WICCF|nr:37S ribosomal protein S18, mitochondrial [Wickerhamomyces ciferrii]CCH44440.1 37S ribosomal protein S18, mitochondrial [Wickerhamomyces ciferrii]